MAEALLGTITTFDHTADLGLRIEADDLDDLFRTAAEGLVGCLVANREAVRPIEAEAVALRASSTADLLVDWMNELVFRCETRHRFYSEFDVHVDEDALGLHGDIAGEPIDPDRHVLDHEVKAVTHHGLKLECDGARWMAEVILDI